MKNLIILIFLVFAFASCQKEEIPTIGETPIEFRGTSDWAGFYLLQPSLGLPCYCDYFDFKSDGTFEQMQFDWVAMAWIPYPGGITGTFTEVGTGEVEITGLFGTNVWVDITGPYTGVILDNRGGGEFLRKI